MLMGRNESNLATYKPGSRLAIVSLGRREGVAQLPFVTISGCIPGLIKSGDLFVGKTRKELGLAPWSMFSSITPSIRTVQSSPYSTAIFITFFFPSLALQNHQNCCMHILWLSHCDWAWLYQLCTVSFSLHWFGKREHQKRGLKTLSDVWIKRHERGILWSYISWYWKKICVCEAIYVIFHLKFINIFNFIILVWMFFQSSAYCLIILYFTDRRIIWCKSIWLGNLLKKTKYIKWHLIDCVIFNLVLNLIILDYTLNILKISQIRSCKNNIKIHQIISLVIYLAM